MNWGPPNLRFTNYGGLTDGNSSLNRNQTSSAGDSLLWVRGAHNLTFGGDYRRMQFNQFADNNGRGSFTFTGYATSLYANGLAQSGTGYDLADFLLGMPAASSIRYGNPDKYFRGSGYDTFVNDDWRLTSRFSLILGLRWEYATPMRELYNRLVNLAIGPDFTSISAVQPVAADADPCRPQQLLAAPRVRVAARRPGVRWWCAADTASTTTPRCTTSSPATWRSSRRSRSR